MGKFAIGKEEEFELETFTILRVTRNLRKSWKVSIYFSNNPNTPVIFPYFSDRGLKF